MAKLQGDRLGEPEEEITDGLAVTDPYPHDGPDELQGEAVTAKHPAEAQGALVTKMNEGAPEEPMDDGQTHELKSEDITILTASEVASLFGIESGQARGVPVEKVYDLTTQQLADAMVSGSISEAVPTRMITEVTTELVAAEQVEAIDVQNELRARVEAVFDNKVSKYIGQLDVALRYILSGVRDKLGAKFEGVHVDNADQVVDALGMQIGIIIEMIMKRQFEKLIADGHISVRSAE